MSLSRKIVAAVEAGGDSPLVSEAGPHRLSLQLTASGPVGVAFDALDFAILGQADLSAGALRGWGDRLAARLTYLMEPLVVLEVDAEAGEAELRSQAPTARDDRRSFTEVRLRRDGTLHLRRLAFETATRRRGVVASQMTLEALERLADDLVACSP